MVITFFFFQLYLVQSSKAVSNSDVCTRHQVGSENIFNFVKSLLNCTCIVLLTSHFEFVTEGFGPLPKPSLTARQAANNHHAKPVLGFNFSLIG